MSMINDIQAFLIAQSLVTEPSNRGAWPCFLGFMPDGNTDPDQCVSLHVLPGAEKPSQWGVIHSRIMVQVRGAVDYDYEPTRAKIYAIFNALHATLTEVGSDYRSILGTTSEAIHLGVDSKRRHKFVWSLDVIHEV